MKTGRPDAERRLIPRWRASHEAVNAGELRSLQPNKIALPPVPDVPQFEELRIEWRRDQTTEVAADLVSCGVALGRATDREVQEAARLLTDTNASNAPSELRSIAFRVLAGTLGVVSNPTPISFDPESARAELQSQIVVHKRRVRGYPKNALAWTDLARLYTALGQQDKARTAIRVATILAPENRFVLRAMTRFFVHSDLNYDEDNIHEGLYLLRGSRLIRGDPWVMAAEISLSTIAKETPRSLKWARALANADSIKPWDSSELNGALATLAIQQGGIGNPGKLFKKSLREPTENALAQAQWAADKHKVVHVSEHAFKTMRAPAFEALALKHRAERKWPQVIEDCRAWSAMEPTSTRPLILGGFVAEVALESGVIAREFSKRALLIAPNEPWAHNNLAVALAYIGELDEAKAAMHVPRHLLHELPNEIYAVSLATQGLLSYRRGEREHGLQLYLKAASTEVAQQDAVLRALIMWHLLREEGRLRAPGTQELADVLWKQTKSLPVPELEALHRRIRYPEPSVSERVAVLLQSVAGQRTSVPAMRDAFAQDFKRLC